MSEGRSQAGLPSNSQTTLPRNVDARKLATADAVIEASIAVAECERYNDSLANNSGEVSVSLKFSRDEETHVLIEGKLATRVNVSCQRCLQPMPLSVASEFRLAVVAGDDQATALPPSLEPVIQQDDSLDVLAVIEDELLLSTPFVNFHEAEDCEVEANAQFGPGDDEASEQDLQSAKAIEKPNPFAALAALKEGKD